MLENTIDEVIHKKFKNENKIKPKQDNKQIKTSITNDNITNKKKIKRNKIKKNAKTNKTQKSNTNNIFLNLAQNQNAKDLSNNIRPIPLNNKNNKSGQSKPKPDTDYELNWLIYKDAIKLDKRSNCEYYVALINSKQLFIFTFCSFNDYNSGVVKKFMFFLSFVFHYTISALFFDERNMHQIYEDKGKYNFGYQIPYIIFSAIISTVLLRLMLQFLVLTDKDILEVKLQETKNKAIIMKEKKLKSMKIKFATFFVLNFILLTLFWYYLTSFNAIYENTQIYLIENTFISFGISLVYPFIINIFPMIIRMSSIHSKNKDQEYFYKISQILQII